MWQDRWMAKHIHTKQLFGGRQTAEEVHAHLAFPKNARCKGCNRKRPVLRCIVMVPFDEAARRIPEIAMVSAEVLMQRVVSIRENPFDKQGKPYVRVSITYACKSCSAALEREAAKAPSWAIVEWNRVRPDRFVSGRAGGSHVD